jgi:hypothetical protein
VRGRSRWSASEYLFHLAGVDSSVILLGVVSVLALRIDYSSWRHAPIAPHLSLDSDGD